ncbi:MAG: NERD domain-containing protein, partial [Solirubrobacterales bacterium]|nr:NERD domain-containing protein [Solirubrobacterales bacterium]
ARSRAAISGTAASVGATVMSSRGSFGRRICTCTSLQSRIAASGAVTRAASLEPRTSEGPALLLRNRRMPAGAVNIDHLAIAPTGVYVIDAKAWKGKVAAPKPLLESRSCSSPAGTVPRSSTCSTARSRRCGTCSPTATASSQSAGCSASHRPSSPSSER